MALRTIGRNCLFCEERIRPFEPYLPLPVDTGQADEPHAVVRAHLACLLQVLHGEEIQASRGGAVSVVDDRFSEVIAAVVERLFNRKD